MFMNETCKYRIKKFQKINLKILLTNFFAFSESFNFLRISITSAITTTNKIASDSPLSFASRLSFSIAGNFMVYSMVYMSREERLMIPSIVFAMKVTLAGS